MSFDSVAARAALRPPPRARSLPRPLGRLLAYPELLALLGATAVLNLWNLSINGWANTYYAAAVRSIARAGTTSCSRRWTRAV